MDIVEQHCKFYFPNVRNPSRFGTAFCYLLDLPEINSVVTLTKPIRALNNPKIYMRRMCIPVPKRTQKEEHSNVNEPIF